MRPSLTQKRIIAGICKWSLRHECSHFKIVNLFGKMLHLLFNHTEFIAQCTQRLSAATQPPLGESTVDAFICHIDECRSVHEVGARGGSRTHTPFQTTDFESVASAIPPLGRVTPEG